MKAHYRNSWRRSANEVLGMVMRNQLSFSRLCMLFVLACTSTGLYAASGEQVYASGCIACHAAGVLGAPKLGSQPDWSSRRAKGVKALVQNAINGVNAMPPKGGNPALSDADVRAAVEYMLSQLQLPAAKKAEESKQKPEQTKVANPVSRKAEVVRPATRPARVAKRKGRPVNSFNRLMKPPSQRNLPPMRDGIHDASNDGTAALQHPKEAFAPMPKANSGNRVDWVAALNSGDVRPRFDLEDETRVPVVLDLNIVREVKGSMPDVVYPHKQHTEWLDCSNCHPAIFVPKKGANNISMASILLGEQCGVCHGKVAFPVSECRKCHSKNKPVTAKK